MALDDTTRSRRSVLAAALGGAGALALQSLTKPRTASADTGGNLILGNPNTADAKTALTSSVNGVALDVSTSQAGGTGARAFTGDGADLAADTTFTGLYGFSEDPDTFTSAGVWGDTLTGIGVVGTGYWGVLGAGVSGVAGFVDDFVAGPGSSGVFGASSSGFNGVYGFAGDSADPGPAAKSGVTGRAGAGASYGVVAASSASSQYALYVAGRLKMTTSAGARTTIASTASSKKITLAGVTSSSFVVATLQTSVSGCYVRNVVCGTGYFTIYLSKAPGKTVAVGYVVVN